MNRSVLSVAMFICGGSSLAIAVFQLVGSRFTWAGLSLLYAGVFLAGAVANQRRAGGPTSSGRGRGS